MEEDRPGIGSANWPDAVSAIRSYRGNHDSKMSLLAMRLDSLQNRQKFDRNNSVPIAHSGILAQDKLMLAEQI